jgi:coatomer protein complex subunit gamma
MHIHTCVRYGQLDRSRNILCLDTCTFQGGFEFKKSIVDTILVLIGEIPDAVESGLAHLCEFIEDCEFTYLRCVCVCVCACVALCMHTIEH